MALQIRKPTDHIEIKSVRVLLYGQPGVRKSSWAMTAHTPYLLDADNGVRRIEARFRQDYGDNLSWSDILEAVNTNVLDDYRSLILDTAGKAIMLCTKHMVDKKLIKTKSDGSPTLQGFGSINKEFQRVASMLMMKQQHCIIVAHQTEDKNGDDVFVRPDVSGKNLPFLIRDMDLVGYVHIWGGRPCVSFSPSESFFAKNSCGLPDRFFLDERSLASVIDQFIEMVNSESTELKNYKAQLVALQAKVDAVQTCEALNDIMVEFQTYPFLLDAKLMARQMVVTKAAGLSCDFDKTTKRYVTPKAEPADQEAAVVEAAVETEAAE